MDFSKLSKSSPDRNLEYSFHVAEKELGVPRLLDVEGKISNENNGVIKGKELYLTNFIYSKCLVVLVLKH